MNQPQRRLLGRLRRPEIVLLLLLVGGSGAFAESTRDAGTVILL